MAKDTDIQVAEYDAILRQAVAVIDRTRTMVATTICSAIGSAHWEIANCFMTENSKASMVAVS